MIVNVHIGTAVLMGTHSEQPEAPKCGMLGVPYVCLLWFLARLGAI